MKFTDFKKTQKSSNDLSKLMKAIEKSSRKDQDDRFWYPELDKAGNGQAIIRFLPEPAIDGEDGLPFVHYWEHGFKGPTGLWYIEKSLTTLGQKDPVSEYNSTLWNSTDDDSSAARKQARAQKRKLRYVSNIYVISDPKNPQNEGKVFLFRYGKKVFDKIDQLLHPQFEEDSPVSVFNMFSGCNFKLRIRTVEGFANYDSSVFEAPSQLPGSDDELKTIWEKEYSLKEFIDPSSFKTYDQLKERLDEVLNLKETSKSKSDSRAWEPKIVKANPAPKSDVTEETDVTITTTEEEDADLEYFRKLADA